MTELDAHAPALGVEERSDEAPRAGAGRRSNAAPDPEVVAKPTRRQFSAEYRLRIRSAALGPARWDGCFAVRVCTARI